MFHISLIGFMDPASQGVVLVDLNGGNILTKEEAEVFDHDEVFSRRSLRGRPKSYAAFVIMTA